MRKKDSIEAQTDDAEFEAFMAKVENDRKKCPGPLGSSNQLLLVRLWFSVCMASSFCLIS
jgi:hypothetical protein